MHIEQKNLEQQNLQLHEECKKRSKAQQHVQRLYQSLKQQQVAAGIEFAAEQVAGNVLHEASNAQSVPRGHRVIPSRESQGSGSIAERNRTLRVSEQQHVSGVRAGVGTPRKFDRQCSLGA